MAWQGGNGRIAIAGIITGLALCAPGTASAAKPQCSLDAAGHKLTVEIVDEEGVSFDYYMDQIWITGADVLDQATCAGGTPTNTNVDRVLIRKQQGFSGAAEVFFFFNPATFAPGFSDAGDTSPDDAAEIEWTLQMGAAPGDRLTVQGQDESLSTIDLGEEGMNVNPLDEPLAPDPDFRLKGVDTLFMQPGINGSLDVSGSGGMGLGAPVTLPFDFGTPRNRGLLGGFHADSLEGGSGDDEIKGYKGVDSLRGGRGDDKISAKDGAGEPADAVINCGPGKDSVKVDPVDPDPVGCERVIIVS